MQIQPNANAAPRTSTVQPWLRLCQDWPTPMALWYGEPLEVHGNALWMRLWGLPQETYAKSLPVDTTPFWQTLYEAVGSVLQNQRASQLRHVRLPIAESVINSCVHVSLTPLLDEEKVCRGVMCALTPTENRNVFQFMV